ncbi:hypothetical protein GA0115252_14342 [Streptomyces sp. DfronAA-171]|nr:hypothetical protein GA0115252_14342 [Streptomyces sp. DfronAA-171]
MTGSPGGSAPSSSRCPATAGALPSGTPTTSRPLRAASRGPYVVNDSDPARSGGSTAQARAIHRATSEGSFSATRKGTPPSYAVPSASGAPAPSRVSTSRTPSRNAATHGARARAKSPSEDERGGSAPSGSPLPHPGASRKATGALPPGSRAPAGRCTQCAATPPPCALSRVNTLVPPGSTSSTPTLVPASGTGHPSAATARTTSIPAVTRTGRRAGEPPAAAAGSTTPSTIP